MTIRRQPSDFVVTERLSGALAWQMRPAPPARGPSHALYCLTKTSLTTPEAVQALAKALTVPPGSVGYAGLKDKHAQTSQFVSVELAEPPAGAPRRTPPPALEGRQWSAVLEGFVPQELTAQSIEGNAFRVVVRDLNPQRAQQMDERARLLEMSAGPGASPGATLLMVNYFGDQRFGSARHGEGFAARRLIEGDFLGALRLLIATPSRKDAGKTREFRRLAALNWGQWDVLAKRLPRCAERGPIERLAQGGEHREAFAALPAFLQMMCVEAYQSHLWNDTTRRLADQIARGVAEAQGNAAVIEAPDPFGVMLFPSASDVNDEWRAIEFPLLAPSSVLEDPWGPSAKEALEAEGIELSSLRIPGLRRPYFGAALRRLFVEVGGFSMGPPEPDDLAPRQARLKRTLEFQLPKGSYATVVLRALGQ